MDLLAHTLKGKEMPIEAHMTMAGKKKVTE